MKDVYTAADLNDWESVTKDLEKPALLAVIGDPVAHSKSPQMHQPALDECGIDGTYIRLHLTPEEVPDALGKLAGLGFVGVNCTIPHKAAALEFVEEAAPDATRMGAVNTIVFRQGSSFGFNTDGGGLRRAVREEFQIDLCDLRVAVIGAGGGAGRSVAVQCALDRVERLVLCNRSPEKAAALAKELGADFDDEHRLVGAHDRLELCEWSTEGLERHLGTIDLIVNATPLGMSPADPPVIAPHLLEPHHMVLDMVYSSFGETPLVRAVKSAGGRGCNGLSMLLHQGALSFERWFGRSAPLETMREGLMGTT